MPGIMPAIKSDTTDEPVETLYSTIGMDGGIITPIVPAVATNAKAKERLYPSSIIVGITIAPTAATVAGPEPDTAAKNMHTKTVTIASPPVILPKNTLQTSSILFDTPPAPIKSPAKINIGTAKIGKESQALIIACGTEAKLIESPETNDNNVASPMAMPTGMLNIKKTTSDINKMIDTIIFSPYHCPIISGSFMCFTV